MDTVAAGGSQAVVAQQGLAVVGLWGLADSGRIAIHSMAFVVLVAPAAVREVVTLRFPMFRSICSMILDFVFCCVSVLCAKHIILITFWQRDESSNSIRGPPARKIKKDARDTLALPAEGKALCTPIYEKISGPYVTMVYCSSTDET